MAVNDEDDKPLDPAVERVRRKMVRLMAVSIGIMMAGLMAVLLTIVYKVTARQDGGRTATPEPGLAAPTAEGRIELPAGARILSSDLDGGHILIRLRLAEGAERLMVYSLGEGRIIATVAIE
ncbi:MAG: hypothetical protein BroJett030_18880 [Alphaproteobacteria bacterium]|nr:MAG: hypothetical protein BroJett030_18880 [Alphaproteobacteria bacterium]